MVAATCSKLTVFGKGTQFWPVTAIWVRPSNNVRNEDPVVAAVSKDISVPLAIVPVVSVTLARTL